MAVESLPMLREQKGAVIKAGVNPVGSAISIQHPVA